MKKTIRPGLPAYLPLGVILAGVVAIWVAVWVTRGSQTGAWQPMLVAIYGVWVVFAGARVITVSDTGLTCYYRFRQARYVSWDEIGSSTVTYWMTRVPTQILIYGQSITGPILTIPLGLYSRRDVEYLMGIKQLKNTQ